MVFVGHLDLMRLFDRACRRAALPISADESPFAVRQRIYTALPLPLGEREGGVGGEGRCREGEGAAAWRSGWPEDKPAA